MLVNKTDFTDKIVTVKMVTDNNQLIEAIGQYVSGNENSVVIKGLHALVPNQTPNGMEMGFMQFFLLSEKDAVVELNRSTVAAISLANSAAQEEYKKLFNHITVNVPKVTI